MHPCRAPACTLAPVCAPRAHPAPAGEYRRERWEGPLSAALLLLRDCRQHEHNLAAHTELSLELAALEGSSLDPEQRGAMATAAAAMLAPHGEPAGTGGAAADGQQEQQQGGGMQYSADSASSPWLTVLPLCAGFFDPLQAAGAAVADAGVRSRVRFGAAVRNNLPIGLPLAGAELRLGDALGTFTAPLLPEPRSSGGGVLPPGAWQRLVAAIPARCSGRLEATAVVLRFGDSGGGDSSSSLTYELPALLPQAALPERPQSPRAGRPAPSPPLMAVGWVRGGWASDRPPFRLAAG